MVEDMLCLALVDTGSQVTTISQSFVEQHLPHAEVRALDDLLTVKGAGGNILPYSGYIEVDLCLQPDNPAQARSTLALVMTGPAYQPDVPIIIGTNVIQPYLEEVSRKGEGDRLPVAWMMAQSAMSKIISSNGIVGVIKTTKEETIAPNSRRIVKGLRKHTTTIILNIHTSAQVKVEQSYGIRHYPRCEDRSLWRSFVRAFVELQSGHVIVMSDGSCQTYNSKRYTD